MKFENYRLIRQSIVDRSVRHAFDDRKGHGGSDDITYRQLNRHDLTVILMAAIGLTIDEVVRYERSGMVDGSQGKAFESSGGAVTRFAASLGIRKCAIHTCANPVDIRRADGSDGYRCRDHSTAADDGKTDNELDRDDPGHRIRL